jgi:nucleoside 2-deoxyribosyltransferase
MKIYLAARYSRREELVGYKARLEALGHEVTSRWLSGDHFINCQEQGDDGEYTPEYCAMRERFAIEDFEDVVACDAVMSFTEPRDSTCPPRGGRHVEMGMGIALGKELIVVGYRENIFHWLPQVIFCEDFEKACFYLERDAEVCP